MPLYNNETKVIDKLRANKVHTLHNNVIRAVVSKWGL